MLRAVCLVVVVIIAVAMLTTTDETVVTEVWLVGDAQGAHPGEQADRARVERAQDSGGGVQPPFLCGPGAGLPGQALPLPPAGMGWRSANPCCAVALPAAGISLLQYNSH